MFKCRRYHQYGCCTCFVVPAVTIKSISTNTYSYSTALSLLSLSMLSLPSLLPFILFFYSLSLYLYLVLVLSPTLKSSSAKIYCAMFSSFSGPICATTTNHLVCVLCLRDSTVVTLLLMTRWMYSAIVLFITLIVALQYFPFLYLLPLVYLVLLSLLSPFVLRSIVITILFYYILSWIIKRKCLSYIQA